MRWLEAAACPLAMDPVVEVPPGLLSALLSNLTSACVPALLILITGSLVAVSVAQWVCGDRSKAGRRSRALQLSLPATASVASQAKRSYPEHTIEEVRLHAKPNDAWVVVREGIYDITKWAPHHPGGKHAILNVAGRDVTDVFNAFHHDPGMREKLENFRIGTLVGYTPSKLVQDFRALERELHDEALFAVDDGFFLKRWAITLIPFPVAVALIVCFQGQTGVQLLGAALVGLFWWQLAFLGHDAGHRSHMNNRDSDHFTSYCMILPLLGIGIEWWIDSHNTHHVVCNDVHCDPDIQHLPMIAISPKFFESLYSSYHGRVMTWDFLGRCMVSVQHILYYPLMCVSRLFLYVQSALHLIKRRQNRLYELAAYAIFFLWNALLASYFQGGWARLGYLLVSQAASGILHLQITLSHFSMPVIDQPLYRNDGECWVVAQLCTTMDVDCPPWMDWFHGGLQFQAIHHLFPKLPRYNLRRVQGRVRALAEKHGVAYHCLPFLKANVQTYRALRATAKQAWSSGFKFGESMLYEASHLIG